jgi:hypothetical protein
MVSRPIIGSTPPSTETLQIRPARRDGRGQGKTGVPFVYGRALLLDDSIKDRTGAVFQAGTIASLIWLYGWSRTATNTL